jgi:hypothetical protein
MPDRGQFFMAHSAMKQSSERKGQEDWVSAHPQYYSIEGRQQFILAKWQCSFNTTISYALLNKLHHPQLDRFYLLHF